MMRLYMQLGKVFGLPEEEIKSIAKNKSAAGQDSKIDFAIRKAAQRLSKYHVHSSLRHADNRRKYYQLCNLLYAAKGLYGAQMDMFTAEDIGINKFDILSQRGLGHIKECLTAY